MVNKKEELKDKIKKIKKETVKKAVIKPSRVMSGDLVSCLNEETSKREEGVVSLISGDMASVDCGKGIKMIEVEKLTKVKAKELKFKDLFFLNSEYLEKLQNIKHNYSDEKKIKFVKSLKEIVDYYKNGEFKNKFDIINEESGNFENIDDYFNELRRIISKSKIKLDSLGYNEFTIDLVISFIFDENGQRATISSTLALNLISSYVEG